MISGGPTMSTLDARWRQVLKTYKVEAAKRLFAAAYLCDPSDPDKPGRWTDSERQEMYAARNGALVVAAAFLHQEGMPVTIHVDEYGWKVLTVQLPTGQVTWHLPLDTPDHGLPTHHTPWDGHDTTEKYRRVSAWVSPVDSDTLPT